jgi:hypothetical protein
MASPGEMVDVGYARAVAAIKRERGCSLDEAIRIYHERQLEERQAAIQAFGAEIDTAAMTVDRAAKRMPHHQRELMLELPWRHGLAMAIQHLAPRQRGRCERRPRARSVRRRRPSRSTRAGPSDPDDPEPAGPGGPVGDTSRAVPRHITHALEAVGFDPFARPVDRLLAGLRAHASDAYRLVPGEANQPDRWIACCPLHVDVGFTLVVTDRGDDRKPAVWCRVGCPEKVIRRVLVPDPEAERAAAATARAIVWAQTYGKRRRAA